VIILAIVIAILAIACVVLAYYLLKTSHQFESWKRTEEQRLGEARKAAIDQSRAVLGGKFVEQMAPYLPEFKYDPTEARFIGSPIDLIVFPGLSRDDPEEVVLIEVKTGKSQKLTVRERKIRELIETGKVRWESIYRPSTTETGHPIEEAI
jgi:predicted Holliday junction resolvase-like endonuclease